MTAKPNIKALVFDAYGTLFDVHAVVAVCEQLFPNQGAALSRAWRAKQLEYTWLRSLMGRYEDFWQVTEAALRAACRSLGLQCDSAMQAQLMNAYLRLEPYPDVAPTLQALAHLPLAILSNGSPRMLRAVVEYAELGKYFTHLLSVDAVKIYKPSPHVYQLAPQALGLAETEIGFVSSNAWDAVGAKAFGFWTGWVNRTSAPVEELGATPDVTVSQLTGLPALLP